METILRILCMPVVLWLASAAHAADIPANDGIDALYAEIIRTVEEVDFDGMRAAYHDAAVVVTLDSSVAIDPTVKRWRRNGLEAKERGDAATVAFRISSRVLGENSAFDTGIFRYSTRSKDGEENVSYIGFEGLLIKKDDRWLWLMERQKERVSEAEWNAIE